MLETFSVHKLFTNKRTYHIEHDMYVIYLYILLHQNKFCMLLIFPFVILDKTEFIDLTNI